MILLNLYGSLQSKLFFEGFRQRHFLPGLKVIRISPDEISYICSSTVLVEIEVSRSVGYRGLYFKGQTKIVEEIERS